MADFIRISMMVMVYMGAIDHFGWEFGAGIASAVILLVDALSQSNE